MICENCGKEHLGNYGSGRFCSKKCARTFSTKNVNHNETKIVNCNNCGKELEILKNSKNNVFCEECSNFIKSQKIKHKLTKKLSGRTFDTFNHCWFCGKINCDSIICKNKLVYKGLIVNKRRANMKRIVYVLGLSVIMSGAAFADGNAFTPLNFNDTAYTAPTTSFATQAANAISEAEAIGNGNIQNAIAQLENAQVDIRNDLLNCKTKFADVDAQYKLIKAERASLKKQVRTIERRIKDIDNAKEKIRKNML